MKKLICLTLLFVSGITIAQNENGLWKRNNSNKTIINNEKSNFPQENIFNLDFESLKKALKTSPKRDIKSKNSNTIITLPTVEGKMERFEVFENSILAPELAAKYPEIKSYVAVGVDNPSVRAYLSSSSLGFKSMIIYPNKETVFIEPITADNLNYTIYKSNDRKRAFSKFECNDEAVAIDLTNKIASNSSELMRGADDSKLRTYRLAISCTGEYAAYFGGTKAAALSAINNSITRVNGIFERDFGVRFVLVGNNDAIVYTDATTDPFSTSAYFSNELQTNLNTVIGDVNFDLGHLFDNTNAGGSSGGLIGITNSKGRGYSSKSNPAGDLYDVQFVCHELAHQMGAKHTFTYVTESSNAAQMEPGSGSTIMSYAGKTVKDIQAYYDYYFHAISIEQVTDKIKTLTCGTVTLTGNAVPVVNAGLDYTIPKGTPFMLSGSATDANTADQLTYTWEQMDLGNATTTVPTSTNTTGSLFRSYNPTTSPTRFFPALNTILSGATSTAGYRIVSETLPMVARTLNFRLTVRDNKLGGGANSSDDMVVYVDGVAGPFTVDTQNTAVTYTAGTSQTINWTVAGTNANGVNCTNVDVLLSTDGGVTFPITLVANTPNDGSQSVVIPNVSGSTNRIMVKGSNHIFFDINNANFTIIGSGQADTVAPIASTLSASGTTTSSTNLTWNASSDNVGVAGYKVYQNGVLKTTTSETSLLVTGLTASTSYSFYVTSYDAAGNSSVSSNAVNVTTLTPADTTAPTATIVSASGTTTSSTNLTWNISTDNIGVIGYKVYQNGILKTTASTTSLPVSGLSASTTYNFYVIAYDAAGNNSVASNTVNVTTLTPADTTAPTATVVSASGTTTNSTNLSWNVSTDNVAVTAYKVYQNGVLISTTSSTSIVVSGLSSSTTYSFYVVASDAAGNVSSASNTLNVITLAPALVYCNSSGSTTYEYINKVQFASIVNNSGNNGGYGNFTAMSTNVNVGSVVTITIFPAWVGTTAAEGYNVWIDYDQNGKFDANELVFTKSKSKSSSVSGSFTIPTTAINGSTRMRVSMKYNANSSACEVFARGEVEDYTVNIVNNAVVRIKEGNVKGENEDVAQDENIAQDENAIKSEVEVLDFKLYPNPVKDGIIYLSGLDSNSSFKIFNQMGQEIFKGTIENDSINVSSLTTGIYFVQIANNNSVGVKRFIKE
ncbi:reprolysin-like metallopeptidase [Flavobacterium urocaniciphilum]|nr:GEVED domain-containing protein [Flavobacterium urocaniciphilum]